MYISWPLISCLFPFVWYIVLSQIGSVKLYKKMTPPHQISKAHHPSVGLKGLEQKLISTTYDLFIILSFELSHLISISALEWWAASFWSTRGCHDKVSGLIICLEMTTIISSHMAFHHQNRTCNCSWTAGWGSLIFLQGEACKSMKQNMWKQLRQCALNIFTHNFTINPC